MSTSYFNYEIDSDMYDNYIDTLNVVAKDNSKTFKIKFDNKNAKI